MLGLVGHVDEVVDHAAGHELVAELAQQGELAPVRELGQRPVGHLHQHERERVTGTAAAGLLGRQAVAEELGRPEPGLGVDGGQGAGGGCGACCCQWAWGWS